MILYELNEVPRKLFDFYAAALPKSAFAFLRQNASLFQTHAADIGHLSPWVSWPTLHKGVPNTQHTISDLGQDIKFVNSTYPDIWEYLSNSDMKIGMFGALHSYPLPSNLQNYEFYVPDTFAAGPECSPKEISAFQNFNLAMVQANGLNVNRSVSRAGLTNFIYNSRKLGITTRTMASLSRQILSEFVDKDRLVRRRTSQAEISFDVYMKQLNRNSTNFSIFFTNHVASSMHRYWQTIFPNDYDQEIFDRDWLLRWSEEIPHAVKIANYQIWELIKFCLKTKQRLVVASSMGQAAVSKVQKIDRNIFISDVQKLLEFISIPKESWDLRMSMAPQVVIKPKTEQILEEIEKLHNITINGKAIKTFITSTGDIRIETAQSSDETLYVCYNGKQIDHNQVGLKNVHLQDAAGAYAYHIPQGVLMDFNPSKSRSEKYMNVWTDVNVLDVAPSILKYFGVNKPSYMSGDTGLFQ